MRSMGRWYVATLLFVALAMRWRIRRCAGLMFVLNGMLSTRILTINTCRST